MMRIQRRTRSAFTITELMVATALILFIMAIISTVFASASKTYSALKTAGDLQSRLRTGTVVIRNDLACEHFEGPFITGRSGPRVGDQRMDLPGWRPPYSGFFSIRQFGLPIVEPTASPVSDDGSPAGLFSTRTPGGVANGHVLHFTCKLQDGPPSELHCVEVTNVGTFQPLHDRRVNAFPPVNPLDTSGVIYSRWYEVQYFLQPYSAGETTPVNGAGISLQRHSLRRRLRLLAPTGIDYGPMDQATAATIIQSNPGLALSASPIPGLPAPNNVSVRVLGPEDVANPQYRMTPLQVSSKNGAETGDDILMTDVISFEVKAAWFENQTLAPAPFNTPPYLFERYAAGSSPAARPIAVAAAPTITINSDAPYDNIPQSVLCSRPGYAGQRVFDTWYQSPNLDGMDWNRPSNVAPGFLVQNPDVPPLRINVRSIQIKLRVWDSKSEMSRQVTIIQEI